MPIDPRLLTDTDQFHGPTPILGPDGKPYRRELTPSDKSMLGEELSSSQLIGSRQFFSETVATGLTPGRLAAILREATAGDAYAYLTLAEEMEERELNYAAALGTRKRALSRIRPTIDAEGVEPRIAAAARELVAADAFHSMVKDAVDALGKGFSVNEIVWGMKDGLWWPQGYRYRDPRFFTFDWISRSELRLADQETLDGLELPPAKFIRHIPKMKSGIPIRGGLARMVAWAFMFKSFTLKDWMSFLDVYGMPMRVGKYHPNATEPERRTLLRAVSSIASDAAAIIPESMQIDFVEAKGFADKPFETFAGYLDGAIATLVLGQTLTTTSGGSLGQAKVHNEIRLDLAEDDAFELGVTINRDLLSWFVSLNFGADARVPRCEFRVEKPEFVSVLTSALGTLVPLGLKVSQEDVRARIGMPSPAAGAELLMPPAGGAALPSLPSPAEDGGEPTPLPVYALNAITMQGAAIGRPRHSVADLAAGFRCGCGCNDRRIGLNRAAEAASARQPDIIDMIGLDDSQDWVAQTGPMVDAVMEAVERCGSYAEFLDELKKLYGAMPSAEMQRRLAIATTKARGLGQVTDDV